MKFNSKQRKIFLITLLALIATLFYVPTGVSAHGGFFIEGWGAIWKVRDEDIHIKLVLMEWLGIILIACLLFLFFNND